MFEDKKRLITASVLLLFFIPTATANCLVEKDIRYNGNNVGARVTLSDWQSCRSRCTENEPSATHFQYRHGNGKCRCKSSDSGRRTNSGFTSGETNCEGKWDCSVSQKEVKSQLVE